MFWHDQTKVGNYDAAVRIPERLYGRLAERQRKTLDLFTARYGYRPGSEQRARLALFPTIYRSQGGTVPLTHQWFYSRFRPWADEMDLGHCVPHQARHTLATNPASSGPGTPQFSVRGCLDILAAERQARRLLRRCTIEQLIYSKIQATAGQDDRAWKRRTAALIESNPRQATEASARALFQAASYPEVVAAVAGACAGTSTSTGSCFLSQT